MKNLRKSILCMTVVIAALFQFSGCKEIVYQEKFVEKNYVSQVVFTTENAGENSVVVKMTTQTAGAVIHYTTDGKTPSASSTVYSKAVTLNTGITVKAIAVKSGMENSPVSTLSLTKTEQKKYTQEELAELLNDLTKDSIFETILSDKSASELLEKLSTETKAEILNLLLTDEVKKSVYSEKLTNEEKARIFTELLSDKRTEETFLSLLTDEEKTSVYNAELTEEKKAAIFTEIFTDKRTNGKVVELLNDEEKEAVFNALLVTNTSVDFVKEILDKDGNEELRASIKDYLVSELTQEELSELLSDLTKNSIFETILSGKSASELLEKLSTEKKAEILNLLLTDEEKESVYSEKLSDEEKARIFTELLSDKRTEGTFLSLLTDEEKNAVYNAVLTEEKKAEIFTEIFTDKRTNGKVVELLNDEEKEAVFNALLVTNTSVDFVKEILDKDGNEELRASIKDYLVSELTQEELQALLDAKDTTAPASVTNLTAENRDASVYLSWTDAEDTDVLAYEITYTSGVSSRSVSFEQNSLVIPQGNGKAFIPGLTNGRTYTFSVRTVDTTGNKSEAATVSCEVKKYRDLVFEYNKYGVLYSTQGSLYDYFGYEGEIIKGDKITISINGYAMQDLYSLGFVFAANAEEEGGWWGELAKTTDYEDEYFVLDLIKEGSYFSFTKTLEVKKVAKTRNLDQIVMQIKTKLAENESDEEHRDSIELKAAFTFTVDKSQRISPVTVTYNPNKGTADKTSEQLYPGQCLLFPSVKNENMYVEWKDENGDLAVYAPDHDCVVTAEWKDKLDLMDKGTENKWWDEAQVQISNAVLEQYKDSVLCLEVTHTQIETESWGWPSLTVWDGDWTNLRSFKNSDGQITYKIKVSEIYENHPSLLYVFLYRVSEEKGFSDVKLYLEMPSKITYVLDGGTMDVTSESLPAGNEITREPDKEGFMFKGWYDEDDNPVTTVPSEDCTLYAKWESIVKVTYVFESRIVREENSYVGNICNYKHKIRIRYEDLVFDSYYLDSEYSIPFNGVVTGDMTVYIKGPLTPDLSPAGNDVSKYTIVEASSSEGNFSLMPYYYYLEANKTYVVEIINANVRSSLIPGVTSQYIFVVNIQEGIGNGTLDRDLQYTAPNSGIYRIDFDTKDSTFVKCAFHIYEYEDQTNETGHSSGTSTNENSPLDPNETVDSNTSTEAGESNTPTESIKN